MVARAAGGRRGAWLAAAMLAVAGCSCRKTDAERAREERAQMDARVRSSLALFPYRLVKLVLRSNGSPNRPQAVDRLLSIVEETQGLPEHPATAEEVARVTATYAKLLVALYDARSTMQHRDEDEFPSLWAALGTQPAPPGYDPPMEHLTLATVFVIIDLVDKSNRVPATGEVIFYELSRAAPQPLWPRELRLLAQLLRGTAFCREGYSYAAEEELTAYLTEIESIDPHDLRALADRATPEQTYGTAVAAGRFVRAWNRTRLKRDDDASEDLEAGLSALQRAGIENEATHWGSALVHLRRGRYGPAAVELDAVAASPYLEADVRDEVRASAEALRRKPSAVPLATQGRATVAVGRALVARAGGLEGLATALAGPEAADRLVSPARWLDRAQRQLTQQLPAVALERSKQELEALKKKVQGARRGHDGG